MSEESSKPNPNPENEGNIENEIEDYEERIPFISKKDLQNFPQNLPWFLRFFVDILKETPEAESYPAFFLPALTMVLLSTIAMGIGFYKVLLGLRTLGAAQPPSAFSTLLLAALFSATTMACFVAGLWLTSAIAKGSNSLQDVIIASGIFCLPLTIGIFLAWLLAYGVSIIPVLILFLAHCVAIIALFSSLPKILLLKGLSRFNAVAAAISAAVLATAILTRLAGA